jgi:hypothetical protein
MQRLRIASVPILLMVAACVHKDIRSPEASAEPVEAPVPAYAPDGSNPAPAELPKAAPAAPAPDTNTASSLTAAAPAPSASPGSAPGPKQARSPGSQSNAPVAKTPASGPSTVPPAAVAPNATTSPAAASRTTAAAAPALDLKTLEQRLRDTHAIGVFTKLSLKNQVDDLLAQFKTFYGGHSQITLVQLRQKYEVLLLKVVSVLQNDDPQLASAIASSRESIWSILADPKSFANI